MVMVLVCGGVWSVVLGCGVWRMEGRGGGGNCVRWVDSTSASNKVNFHYPWLRN